MKKRRRRSRLSLGTIFMLLLTLLVVLGCAWFWVTITGGDVAARAADAIASFTFAEDTPQPVASVIPVMSPQPAVTAQPTSAVTAVPTAAPTPVPEKTAITIAAVGAVYAPKAIRQTVETGANQTDFAPVFAALTDVLAPADLAIATLETTTAGSEKGYGNYNTPPEILDALRACGIDLISLATERALDKDYDGLSITLQEITGRGLSYAGVYPDSQSAGRATMMRIGGVQVAVLAYSYGLSDEGKQKTGDDSQGMLAMMELERMRSDIAGARLEGANLVIVLPHWGTKNKQSTPETVRTLAQELARAGADVILGTHPNVAQGIERITATRSDGLTYETLVCYSLGSLLTDARTEENTAGMAVTLQVTYDPVTRRVELGSPDVIPLYIARTRIEDQTAYRVVPAQREDALLQLDEQERASAQRAARIVYEVTGQEEQP